MSKVQPLNVAIEDGSSQLRDTLDSLLRDEHGAHGLRFMAVDEDSSPDLRITREEDNLQFEYMDAAGVDFVEIGTEEPSQIRSIISKFAVRQLVIPPDKQTSRNDYRELNAFSGIRPNLDTDPSTWIVTNPLIADLSRRFPQYGNLIRYLCNERGLFLKVGNLPNQRAYWNSTLNGGLPVIKKADPLHEGTFMLHDMFHFVPVDPLIGSQMLEDEHKAVYVAHRMLSEASTLVLADMIAVTDARLESKGYDVSKRSIYPLYKSILESKGTSPEVDKLLAANAYFCFTGNPEGFEILGASPDSINQYKQKYEAIFKDDFIWNMSNFIAMMNERQENPHVEEYYKWLEENTPFPMLKEYGGMFTGQNKELDIARLLSLFRADFSKALSYSQPIDDVKRAKLAHQKYLAGQRIVFARFGNRVPSQQLQEDFDAAFMQINDSIDEAEISEYGRRANNSIDTYISSLVEKGLLLPHEEALCRFSAPLYPVRFVNYDKNKVATSPVKLAEEMSGFVRINQQQLNRFLEAVSS